MVYLGICPEDSCFDIYIRESGSYIFEILIDHNAEDKKSHIFKHSSKNCKNHFHASNFKLIVDGF